MLRISYVSYPLPPQILDAVAFRDPVNTPYDYDQDRFVVEGILLCIYTYTYNIHIIYCIYIHIYIIYIYIYI